MTDERARINEAFETISLTFRDAAARKAALAPFGEAAAARVEAIYRETLDEPPPGGESDGGRARVDGTLRARHPWLSEAARGRLITAYLYSWK